MNELEPLQAHLDGLLAQLAPAARRGLARELARRLRESQSKRIAAQQNPDGTAYEPRKPQLRAKKGRLRRTMFAKLRLTRNLKTKATPEGATVEFAGSVQRIAQVHQYGLRDRVNKRGVTAKYAARELLGLTDADERLVEDLVIEHLAR